VNNFARALALILLSLTAVVPVAQAITPSPDEPRSFYADRRAFRTGDMLTILITESSTVTAAAQTTTHKSESGGVTLNDKTGNQKNLGVGINSQSAGGGEIDRSDKFVAQLAVVVQGVDPGGNLIVHGEQDIEINDEKQRIKLDGVVRREDISPNNTVPSTRVAASHIEFTGKGILARKQTPGLLNRILAWFWE
jgi:flagellar L-ring protein precursor FlgH